MTAGTAKIDPRIGYDDPMPPKPTPGDDPTDPEVARRNLTRMFQAMEMSHNMLMAG